MTRCDHRELCSHVYFLTDDPFFGHFPDTRRNSIRRVSAVIGASRAVVQLAISLDQTRSRYPGLSILLFASLHPLASGYSRRLSTWFIPKFLLLSASSSVLHSASFDILGRYGLLFDKMYSSSVALTVRGKKRCSVPRRASDVTRFSSPSNSITPFTMIRRPQYTYTTDGRTSRFRWTATEQTSSTTHTSRTNRSIEST